MAMRYIFVVSLAGYAPFEAGPFLWLSRLPLVGHGFFPRAETSLVRRRLGVL